MLVTEHNPKLVSQITISHSLNLIIEYIMEINQQASSALSLNCAEEKNIEIIIDNNNNNLKKIRMKTETMISKRWSQ